MTKTDEKADELRQQIEIVELESMEYDLAAAIREGAMVTEQGSAGWGNGDTACALHSAVIAGKARGYM